jgi:hypothetical protein
MLKSPGNDAHSSHSKLTVTCVAWRSLPKNTLCGFASIRISAISLTIHDVAVHRKGDRLWAQLPARPWIKNGAIVTGDDGKVQYSPLMELDRREVRDAFGAAVIKAVTERFPDALALEEATT